MRSNNNTKSKGTPPARRSTRVKARISEISQAAVANEAAVLATKTSTKPNIKTESTTEIETSKNQPASSITPKIKSHPTPESSIGSPESSTEPSKKKIWQNAEASFKENIVMLAEFKEKHGHCLVPKVYSENQKLSYWVYRQRRLHKNYLQKKNSKSLTEEKIQKLKEVGFVFNAKSSEVQNLVEAEQRDSRKNKRWNSNFKALGKFKEEHGHCLVPKVYSKDQSFSGWVYNQRAQYAKRKAGKVDEDKFSDEQIQKLNDIGFVWRAKEDKQWQENDRVQKASMADDGWEKNYKDVIAFKEKHGHTMVPKKYRTNQRLSSWVFRQRKYYRQRMGGTSSSMTDDRLKRLEEIDFTFQIRKNKNEEGDSTKALPVAAIQSINSKRPAKKNNEDKKTKKAKLSSEI